MLHIVSVKGCNRHCLEMIKMVSKNIANYVNSTQMNNG